MPYRILGLAGLVVGVVGLAAVAVVLLAGRDVRRAARTGPRWKRALLAGGLSLLGWLGVTVGQPLDLLQWDGPTCYDVILVDPPAQPTPAERLAKLAERVEALDRLAGAETMRAEAVWVALETVEREVGELDAAAFRAGLNEEQCNSLTKLVERARASVVAAKAKLPPAKVLAADRRWKALTSIWGEADDIASGRRGPHPFDQINKDRVLTGLAKAAADTDELVKTGLLTEPEAGLLKAGLGDLQAGVRGFRPVEMQMVLCYAPMDVNPARGGIERVSGRLALLDKLCRQDALKPEVVARLLIGVEKDLAAMGDPEHIRRLNDPERSRAATLRKEAQAHVDTLKARLAKGATTQPDRADPPPPPPAARTYTVQPGDTLWGIAAGQLGNGARFREILDLNPDLDPRNVSVGFTLRLPEK